MRSASAVDRPPVDALAWMAQQLGRPAPGRVDELERLLCRLAGLAALAEKHGFAGEARALLLKVADPRRDLDALLGVKLRRGQTQRGRGVAARKAEADKALGAFIAGLAPAGALPGPRPLARLLLAQPAALALVEQHGLPTSERRLADYVRGLALTLREVSADT